MTMVANSSAPLASRTAEVEQLSLSDQFKLAFRNHPAGVALITATLDGKNVALTATSVSSVCADPAVIAFSVSSLSSSAPVLNEVDSIVVHLIDTDSIDLAKLGATSGIDRFEDTSLWSTLTTGEPVFHDAPVWMRVSIINRTDVAGSTVMLGEVRETNLAEGDPRDENPRDSLVYVNRTWHRLSSASQLDA